jgi:hypothetical protein
MPDYYGVVKNDGHSDHNARRDLVLLAIIVGAVIVSVVLYWIL